MVGHFQHDPPKPGMATSTGSREHRGRCWTPWLTTRIWTCSISASRRVDSQTASRLAPRPTATTCSSPPSSPCALKPATMSVRVDDPGTPRITPQPGRHYHRRPSPSTASLRQVVMQRPGRLLLRTRCHHREFISTSKVREVTWAKGVDRSTGRPDRRHCGGRLLEPRPRPKPFFPAPGAPRLATMV